jgi:hypothetical protein
MDPLRFMAGSDGMEMRDCNAATGRSRQRRKAGPCRHRAPTGRSDARPVLPEPEKERSPFVNLNGSASLTSQGANPCPRQERVDRGPQAGDPAGEIRPEGVAVRVGWRAGAAAGART